MRFSIRSRYIPIPGIKELAQASSEMVPPLVNRAGLRLHEKAGFRSVGTRERIGRHHDRWRDVTLIERRSAIREAQAAALGAGPGGFGLVER